MVRSTDIGSLPPKFDMGKFWKDAASYGSFINYIYPGAYADFERIIVDAMGDKYKSGLDVPTYPQFRGMNEMFLRNIDGIEEVNGNYFQKRPLSITAEKARIAEVSVIRKNLDRLAEKAGGKIELKVCITGPYTLASQLNNRTSGIYAELGKVLSEIAKENVFDEKRGRVALVAIDEPAFGVDDPNLDYGNGRESLLKAWNCIAYEAARLNGVETVLHLHNTSNPLFWESEVDVIESHVRGSIYTMEVTKGLLEEHDKFLKAPIAITQFDDLIKQRIRPDDPEKADPEKIAAEWEMIRSREADPVSYLEDSETMHERLRKIVGVFGEERVPYAGPECGLGGHYIGKYPFYDCAIEYLRRVASVVKDYNASAKAK